MIDEKKLIECLKKMRDKCWNRAKKENNKNFTRLREYEKGDRMSMISEQVKHLKEVSNTTRANVYSFEALSQSIRQAADTIESLTAKLQAADMERPVGRCINENTYIVKRHQKKNALVSIMYNRADDKYHFVNITGNHICSCGFCTIDEAVADMEKQKKERKIDDFYKIEESAADCGGITDNSELKDRLRDGAVIQRTELEGSSYEKCMDRLAEYEDLGVTPEQKK